VNQFKCTGIGCITIVSSFNDAHEGQLENKMPVSSVQP